VRRLDIVLPSRSVVSSLPRTSCAKAVLGRLALGFVFSWSFLSGLAQAQVQPGTPSWSAYDAHAVDTINLQNLNIVLNVPVRRKSGVFSFDYEMQGNYYIARRSPQTATGGESILRPHNPLPVPTMTR
jgi:hypothetical protein